MARFDLESKTHIASHIYVSVSMESFVVSVQNCERDCHGHFVSSVCERERAERETTQGGLAKDHLSTSHLLRDQYKRY